jgi:hypothetical protein
LRYNKYGFLRFLHVNSTTATTMISLKKLLILNVLFILFSGVQGQRVYKDHSVLSTGNWYKISTGEAGVYRMDMAFLGSLGISGNIPSSQVRLFSNGGGMLPEANQEIPPDDLQENAIMVVDGGDGTLNGADYILFYSTGPDVWKKDSLNRRFNYQKNIYSNKAYYFLTIGGNGLRVSTLAPQPAGAQQVSSFDERYHHELDTVNFLSSGKEWFGEEFSSAPGRTLSRSFSLPLSDLVPGQALLVSNVAARSVSVPSRFLVSVNGQLQQQLDVLPITTAQYDVFAQQTEKSDPVVLSQNSAALTYVFTQGSFNSQGWLNWFTFFCRRNLSLPAGRQLMFRDWNSVGGASADFLLSNADLNTQVWEVTDPLRPVRMNASLASGQLRFTNETQRLREFIGFGNNFLTPVAAGRIANQDLHNTSDKDYFIITYPEFIAQANRLAKFHQDRSGLRSLVVTTDQVFNEFSSGMPDPVAFRNFIKMYFDRYASTWSSRPRSLLLLGRASFDYKDRMGGNTNFVPAYESASSLDPLGTYTSDDFFGFLNDAEDINSGLVTNELDIGIGRIPARSAEEAKNFVDKLMDYHDPAGQGAWRNNLNFVADDEDFNLHLQDAEILTATVEATAPSFQPQKIYLDAFRQESGSAGGRYPQANAVINSNIYNGTLVWNYSGHGGPARLAEEVVIDQQIVNSWNNRYRLPLFITATCDFAPYDNPVLNSLGENLLVRPKTGAIALMTTTRVVFANSNRIMNNNYLKLAFQADASGQYKSLGEAMRTAKNFTYQTSGDIINNRKFTLLGDPAMTLAFPTQKVNITRVNGKGISSLSDTLSAGELVEIEGEVSGQNGVLLPDFQGTAHISLLDKVQSIQTQANDANSQVVSFQTQENSLFRGKASVQNGKFTARFRVPKDINYQMGRGKFSLYAQDGLRDGNGVTTNVFIGGISSQASNDNEGPEIRAFLNDEKFVNGSITNPSSILIVKLADSSGINTGGAGIDHDIVATLDGDNRKYFILNNFYEAELDNYHKGAIRFQLPELSPGVHSLKIKAWDAMNNSSEYQLDFIVVNTVKLQIEHVLNYPNPFTTNTSFWFEHNFPGVDLGVKVEIFTVSGKLIKSIAQTINNTGNRSNEVVWDGRDDYGNKIGKGVYIYRLRVKGPEGKTAEKWERLVILGK